MARDISIAFSAKDNFSASLAKMIAAQREMKASGMELQKQLDTLNKTKSTLTVDFERAKRELKEAKKAFNDTEESAKSLNDAQVSYDNIKGQLDMVSKSAKEAARSVDEANGMFSKSGNRAGSSGGGGSLLGALGQAGAYKMVGDLASEAAGVFVQSAFGNDASTMLQSSLSGMASGAAIGSMILPGAGTAIGGAIGTALGAAQGQMQIFQQKDDAFKSVVQERVQNALAAQDETAQSGSGIAASRETAQMAFSNLFKSDTVAADYLEKVKDFAAVTPFEYDDLTSMSRTLATYKYGVNELLPMIGTIGDAGSALGMNTSDMNMVATALGRMKSSGKTSLEYVNLLQERGIDAIGYLSQGMGIDRAEVYEKISKNLIDGAEAAQAITDYMQRDFSGGMEAQSRAYAGLVSSMEDAQKNLDAAMGDGFNSVRGPGIKEQTEWLSSSGMEENYRLIGKWKASLENEKDAAERKAMDDAKAALEKNQEYLDAKKVGDENKAGLIAGEAYARAKADAQAKYEASEGYQEFLASQKKLIDDVQYDQSMNDAYWNAGYELGKKFSEGMLSVTKTVNMELADGEKETLAGEMERLNALGVGGASSRGRAAQSVVGGRNHANGLDYVPYDGYAAVLHEGERVLTAMEARSGGNMPGITIQVNGLSVREEADVYKIASVFCNEIQKARATMAN